MKNQDLLLTGKKPNDKTYCDDYKYYNRMFGMGYYAGKKNVQCWKEIGKKDTPIKEEPIYALPKIHNKKNACQYFKQQEVAKKKPVKKTFFQKLYKKLCQK